MAFMISVSLAILRTLVCAILGMVPVTEALTCNINNCTCIWRNGKQTAECTNGGFTTVPKGLDTGIQVLNLTSNKFRGLRREAFVNAGLSNLQKIYLAHCGIEWIDEFAFNRLTNLIELNLGYNKLQDVPSASFYHIPRLRELILSGNRLFTVHNLAFQSAKSLTRLELSGCHIHTIGNQAFEGLRYLEVLKIDQNNLETFPGRATKSLHSLYEITIGGNPWVCDCNLREFRQWMDQNNFPVYVQPVCNNPSRLRGKRWNHINLKEYACPPRFLNTSNVVNAFEDFNVTLECRVIGDPSPVMKWVWRDRTIANLSEGIYERQVFVILEHELGREKISALEITYVQEPNAGFYSCISENNAGIAVQNFSLIISRRPVTEDKSSGGEKPQEVRKSDKDKVDNSNDETVIGMIIGIIVGAILVFLIFSILLWVLRRKQKSNQRRRSDLNNKTNSSVRNSVPKNSCDEIDLKLLNQVNPIEKPPRLKNYQNIPSVNISQYDPIIRETDQSQHLFVVNVHFSPDANVELSLTEDSSFQPSPLPKKRHSRGLVSVPVLQPTQNLQSRSQKPSDIVRQQHDGKPTERERGDGSSEFEVSGYERSSVPSFGTFRWEELQNSMRSNEKNTNTPQSRSENKTPDLLDHSRRSQPEPSVVWDPYDHPSAYFRPSLEHITNGFQDKEGGTEV
ncbi:uncharacterized protein LOC143253188 [Tachypleus tridentatus]|uniref:uncharacterized protein LOC143253188 n=1 Tax=Tachypleus tridentatus TaxID=6853 RepID=UPI003FCFA12B